MGATFGQHSKLPARPGKKDQLVAKFLDAAEIQRVAGPPDTQRLLAAGGKGL